MNHRQALVASNPKNLNEKFGDSQLVVFLCEFVISSGWSGQPDYIREDMMGT